MGGKGGDIIYDTLKKVISKEYPDFKNVNFVLPDENNRRVGQSIAAASLPMDVK